MRLILVGRSAACLPSRAPSARVLDLGCGAGQTLIGGFADRVTFGVDIDLETLQFGSTLTNNVRFTQAAAELLPFADRSFDMVFARVSLPYSNLPKSLREIYRVLGSGGQFWASLHPSDAAFRQVTGSNYRGKLFFAYVMFNGLLFHTVQRLLPLRGRYESFQTRHGMAVALKKVGFHEITMEFTPPHFVVMAQKP